MDPSCLCWAPLVLCPMSDSCVSSLWANSTNMLHSGVIIDQTPQTRSCLAQALAQQFFGCFISRMSW